MPLFAKNVFFSFFPKKVFKSQKVIRSSTLFSLKMFKIGLKISKLALKGLEFFGNTGPKTTNTIKYLDPTRGQKKSQINSILEN